MAIYLNTDKSLENFKQLTNGKYFVDKTLIIDGINKKINTVDKYLCVTRPRRFGKSSIAEMLTSYYSKAIKSDIIFENLKISKCESYRQHLNKYNLIKIDFSDLNSKNYEEYIGKIITNLKAEVLEFFPNIKVRDNYDLWDILYETKEKFVFILDEWDFIFNKELFTDKHEEYLEFLRNLLKDKSYVALAYMTGILPIKKYSSGSALNMFDEYTFLKDRVYEEYFGFTDEEVKKLCNKNNEIDFKELETWYNGYMTATGLKVYNPRSVVKALNNNYCESYWTNTGKMDEVLEYLKYNIHDVRDDVVKMVNNEEVRVNIREEFRAGQEQPKTRMEIYSAMIVLGFLSYHNGKVKIPNKELMFEFEKAISNDSFEEVSQIIKRSEEMLEATIS
ncbi:AAA family ATPase [Romboutsia sp.]|uniref:AAA family ATPase n=1 Tax=Romboutsia sp. TaxID=1965302 RepID=UPI003F2DCCB0